MVVIPVVRRKSFKQSARGQVMFLILPHSAPSWILSQAENLASTSLQDGATKWYYFLQEPDPTDPTRPPSLVLKLLYYNQCPIILAYMYDHCQTRSGGSLERVWRMSGRCPKMFSDTEFFWHCRIFQLLLNFSSTKFFRPTIF